MAPLLEIFFFYGDEYNIPTLRTTFVAFFSSQKHLKNQQATLATQ